MTKMTQEDLKIAIRRLKQMRFFPNDPGMESELMIELASMCHDAERLMWLTRRAVRVFSDWCGVAEIRALYSSRWRPADGIRAYSAIFISSEGSDGYPRDDSEGERISRLLAAPAPLQIAAPLDEETLEREWPAPEWAAKPEKKTAYPTQEEIERIKSQQNANRKESTPE